MIAPYVAHLEVQTVRKGPGRRHAPSPSAKAASYDNEVTVQVAADTVTNVPELVNIIVTPAKIATAAEIAAGDADLAMNGKSCNDNDSLLDMRIPPSGVVADPTHQQGAADIMRGLDSTLCRPPENTTNSRVSTAVGRKGGEEEGDTDAIDPHQVPVAHALTQSFATRLVSRLTDVRKSGLLWCLRPACKAQVAIEYLVNDDASAVPLMIHIVAIYIQHAVPMCATRTKECAGYTGPEMTAPSIEDMNGFIVKHVLSTTLGEIKLENGEPAIALFGDSTHLHFNPSSKISVGGHPLAVMRRRPSHAEPPCAVPP